MSRRILSTEASTLLKLQVVEQAEKAAGGGGVRGGRSLSRREQKEVAQQDPKLGALLDAYRAENKVPGQPLIVRPDDLYAWVGARFSAAMQKLTGDAQHPWVSQDFLRFFEREAPLLAGALQGVVAVLRERDRPVEEATDWQPGVYATRSALLAAIKKSIAQAGVVSASAAFPLSHVAGEAGDGPIGKRDVRALLEPTWDKLVAGFIYTPFSKLSCDALSAADTRALLKKLSALAPLADDIMIPQAAAFTRLRKIFDANLEGVRAFRIAEKPGDVVGSLKPAIWLVVGKSAAGELVGVRWAAWED